MNIPLMLITVLILVLSVIFILQKRGRYRRYQNPQYIAHLHNIDAFIQLIQSFDDYIAWIQRDQIKTQYAATSQFFKNKTNFYSKEATVKQFNNIYNDLDNYIVQYNQKYISAQKEKLKSYFDQIEGKSLDDQQRTAVITDEYSNLIIAGAGAGKTLTILAKVLYLIEQKGIVPENILLLSFTKKTVDELNERLLKIKSGAVATTFHKLGYDIIKQNKPHIPALTNENTLSSVIQAYLQHDILQDAKVLQSYIQYIACYMNIPESYDYYHSLGEKLDVEKGIDLQTLKSKCESLNIVSKAIHDTIKGERVKSVEELIIANFLYLNGIAYEYEKPYPFDKHIMYRPDFYLSDYDIYLEHFGIDEQNQAKWLTPFNEEKYLAAIQLKRETHKRNHTKLLETYSYYNRDNILLDKLKDMLEAQQVVFKPSNVQNIYTKVTANNKNFGTEINQLIESFINLAKSKRLGSGSLNTLFSTTSVFNNAFMKERQVMFLQFVLPIIEKYDHILQERNEIDFNDMINKAADVVHHTKSAYNYQYIIIDEYQDISYSRFNLIKAIRDLSGAKMICVGDDWQSIYRFAGSDISLFRNFEKYFGKYEQLLIEQTYRNAQSLIDISAKYIQKNPQQIAKWPKSKKDQLNNPLRFVHYKQESVVDTFINEIQRIVAKYGTSSILVLGRHSFDIHDLIKLTHDNSIKYIEKTGRLELKGFESLDIKYLTVHKSKGTEADNVIVLNLKNHLLGFPNKITDDPILSLLLSDSESYRFAEERRLLYVALTRTKNEVVLFLPPDISIFAEEILLDMSAALPLTDDNVINNTYCPYCKTGKLVVRQNALNNQQFLGCSHYPNCKQTFSNMAILKENLLCTDCKSGFMINKSEKYGAFLGCTNYPKCGKTINLM